MHDPLFHGEALLVVASSDAEDVTFEFGSNGVSSNFLAHAAVHEDAEFALIIDFDELLRSVGWVGNVKFHLDGGGGFVKMVVEGSSSMFGGR